LPERDTNFYQGEVLSVNGDIIALDTPLDDDYTTNAIVTRSNHHMNVNGHQLLLFQSNAHRIRSDSAWDITKLFSILKTINLWMDKIWRNQQIVKGIVVRKKDEHTKIFSMPRIMEISAIIVLIRLIPRSWWRGYGFRCVRNLVDKKTMES